MEKIEIPERPDCFEFAMDFLSDPEAPIVLAYIEKLESIIGELIAKLKPTHCTCSPMVYVGGVPTIYECAYCHERAAYRRAATDPPLA